MIRKGFFLTLLTASVALVSCKMKSEVASGVETTGCPGRSIPQSLRVSSAMPDFTRVSLPILKRIVSRHDALERGVERGSSAGQDAGRKVVTMLRNMVAGNVHPLAFFATIGDYETYQAALGGFPWAEVGKRKWLGGKSDVYRAGYCGSATCTGVFQVLVHGDWFSWAQADGLNIWALKGGPDWASTLWWWALAPEKNCTYLSSGPNPCTESGIPWTTSKHVRNGRKAYGQLRQCGVEWDAMYADYLRAMSDSSDRSVRSVADVRAFARAVGLEAENEPGMNLAPSPTFDSSERPGSETSAPDRSSSSGQPEQRTGPGNF